MVDQINICYQIPLFDRVNLIGVFFIVIVYMYLAVLRGCQVAWECAATQHSNLDDFLKRFSTLSWGISLFEHAQAWFELI